ncbi:MAG TPA: membrane dipeptidase [Tepidisphaeraceae bacterium]|nr:membrane dipeptidase [Tepidisphaeraceae bacterium]
MLIVDGHLDLAYNAVRGRDVLLPAARQAADREGIPTVGIPDLIAGGVGLVFATIFCQPAEEEENIPGYRTPDEAAAAGRTQLDWYHAQRAAGVFRFVESAADLPRPSAASTPLPALLLLEGADPIRDPSEIDSWKSRGLRAVGLAWKRTRYAGGTRAPGPLTADGVALARALDAAGMIHDTSHLAEESFWQLLDLTAGPVMASHSNCRAFVPTDRQLSDDMIRALIRRGGVIGMNFYHKFLLPPEEFGKRRATLNDLIHHIRHICNLAGNAGHVAIGTDMDGGLGREEIPVEIRSSADLPRVAEALAGSGFADQDVRGIMGGNWLNFLRKSLR